jgi:hypothetical protein
MMTRKDRNAYAEEVGGALAAAYPHAGASSLFDRR